jgi:hypothetical protein
MTKNELRDALRQHRLDAGLTDYCPGCDGTGRITDEN